MRMLRWVALLLSVLPLLAQSQSQPTSTPAAAAAPSQDEDKRAFYVLPNNRVTERSYPFKPISAKRKMTIAAKDSFDWPVIPTSAAFAGIYQLEDQNPSFGQGMKGYAHRFATAYGDQMLGNMFTEGILPAALHHDPRYFRAGEGTTMYRIGYALTRIFVTRTDSGGSTFNVAEWGGNAATAAISNAYYPDTRTATENVKRLFISCGTDALSNLLKEFWPDVRNHFSHKKQ